MKTLSLYILLIAASGLLSRPASCQASAPSLIRPVSRELLVSIDPNNPPKTVNFDPNLATGSTDLPISDKRVRKAGQGCTIPEQVHLTYWSSTSILVSWATCDAIVADIVPSVPLRKAVSTVKYGTARNKLTNTATAVPTSYVYDYRAMSLPSYGSPLLHHVLLKGLTPGQQYLYRVYGTPDADSSDELSSSKIQSRLFSFTMPKTSFPLQLGVVGDPGQTYNSSAVLQQVIKSKPDMLLLVGDFSYANNWYNFTTQTPSSMHSKYTYQPKWDTFGRLYEPLLSKVPFLHCDGNHELEYLPNGEQDKSYNYRYPEPMRGAHRPPQLAAVSAARPFQNLYYAVELPGVFKAITISSYGYNQTFSKQEEQYRWLERELKKTDRTKTPWLIVISHAPWYNSYTKHYKEVECFRKAYEPLLLKYQVDVMIHGHVHAYERTKPVAEYMVDECGPVHITVGDAGNLEGIDKTFIDQQPQPAYCSNATGLFCQQQPYSQPQCCLSYQGGNFCYDEQPAWSAYREPSFGHGTLELLNTTHARWTWNKVQWPAWKVADDVMIIRGGDKVCGDGFKQAMAALGSD